MSETVPFWEAVDGGTLAVQRCADCGHQQLYARDACARCHRRHLDWAPAAGKGVVYSYTVVRRAPSKQFADEVPYVLGLVELEEGPRILVRIEGCEPDDVRVGLPVEVAGPGDAAGRRLPPFKPTFAPSQT